MERDGKLSGRQSPGEVISRANLGGPWRGGRCRGESSLGSTTCPCSSLGCLTWLIITSPGSLRFRCYVFHCNLNASPFWGPPQYLEGLAQVQNWSLGLSAERSLITTVPIPVFAPPAPPFFPPPCSSLPQGLCIACSLCLGCCSFCLTSSSFLAKCHLCKYLLINQ